MVSSKERMPVLFISHGSPELAVRDTPTHRFLKSWGEQLPTPQAILIISAHWETDTLMASGAELPQTVYDFGPRFDRRLWDITYDAPGAPDIGAAALKLIETETGIRGDTDASRGFDHGVWTPLHLLFPDADIPVAQVSIQPAESSRHHFDIGAALKPLRNDGVLIIASGAFTHNLQEFIGKPIDAPEDVWVAQFRRWMTDRLREGATADLLDYRSSAPHAERNHPEDEHLLPIFAALGAAGYGTPAHHVHADVEYGVLAMDCFLFDA
ncbi:MAG: class III extradiol ring-cleavage dioxygenase [Pseudomonadota bacterium]